MKLDPDFGPNSINLPVLPVIGDARINDQVFTHRSVAARPTHVFEDHPDDPSPDNEKYEHLGDMVLGLVVTNLMFELYPGLRVGPSTKIRSLMVGNSTLADISKRYKLPDRLRLHPAQALTLRASTNVQADVFEAFVGGLFRDQGLGVVQAWLRPLFEPFAREAYHIVRKQHNLPPLPPSLAQAGAREGSITANQESSAHAATFYGTTGHLALFNQHLQKANKRVEWVYWDGKDVTSTPLSARGNADAPATSSVDSGGVTSTAVVPAGWYADPGVPAHLRIEGTQVTPVWYVRVLVDGEFYGRGRGNTKKSARNEAAKEGLVKLGIEV
ncbi:hypothetical protein H1R20_g13776, partial [Candolleomyces eurysporus]